MADNLMKPAFCPSCGAPVEGAKPGEMHKCVACGQTSQMAATPPAPRSLLNITAGGDVKADRIVAGDLHETHTHFHDGVAANSPATIDLACPYCHRVTDDDAKAGRRYICGACSEKSFITADGKKILTWEVAVAQELVSSPKAAPATGGFACPTCKGAVAVKPEKVKAGKKYLCPSCKIFSQMSADLTRLELTDMSSGDVGGVGKGVNFDAGSGDVDVPGDGVGGFKKTT